MSRILGQTVAILARSSLSCAQPKLPAALQDYGNTLASFVRPCTGCLRADVHYELVDQHKGNSPVAYSGPYWRPLGVSFCLRPEIVESGMELTYTCGCDLTNCAG